MNGKFSMKISEIQPSQLYLNSVKIKKYLKLLKKKPHKVKPVPI